MKMRVYRHGGPHSRTLTVLVSQASRVFLNIQCGHWAVITHTLVGQSGPVVRSDSSWSGPQARWFTQMAPCDVAAGTG